MARSKTQKPRKSRKSRKIFSEIFKSGLLILPYCQNGKLGNKKSRNNISEISKTSEISEFSVYHVFIFQKKIFHYSKVFKILPCRKKVYLLWDVSILKRLHFLKNFLKAIYVIEKATCINRSLFIYGVFIYLTWTLISDSVKGFNLATEAIKIWSKPKHSEVSKFSISSIGQNWKLRNLGNWHFFFSNHIVKLMLFLLGHIFDFEFHILPKI